MAPCALNFEVTPEVGSPRIGLRPTTGQATAWLHRIIGDALGCHYEGELRMPSVRAEISILPVAHKRSPNQPGYRVRLDGVEVGAGWHRTDASRKEKCRSPLEGGGRSTPISPGSVVKAAPTCLGTQPFCTKLLSSRLTGFGRHAGEQTHSQRQMTRTDKTAAFFRPSFREYSSLHLETFFRPVGSRFRQYPAPCDR
jgi:hypothetical protein